MMSGMGEGYERCDEVQKSKGVGEKCGKGRKMNVIKVEINKVKN